ncbi:hypothetical protein SAMN05660199_01537 [Klenkia soli]|uniref:Protein RecA n=1 Tax=Klenkia soli TaxID=1052260 RepID=A0A1H0HQM7_9ACTN|nr:hypothetical protein SAMN05660199_01537 [Klenkia soli]
MFDDPPVPDHPPVRLPAPRADRADRLAAARAAAGQADRRFGITTPGRALQTLPALAALLPGGALSTGSAYSVLGSVALATALLAGPSAAGEWCGVVGVPGFGAEAAAAMGVDLDRTVLVPDPGPELVGVVSALVGALAVVLVGPPGPVGEAEAGRLAVRLRQRGTALVVCGPWPRSEAELSLADSTWHGLGAGHGHLAGRLATVTVHARRAARPRRARLWLPDPEGLVRPAPTSALDLPVLPAATLTRSAG